MAADPGSHRAQQLRLAGLGLIAGLPYLAVIIASSVWSNSNLILPAAPPAPALTPPEPWARVAPGAAG